MHRIAIVSLALVAIFALFAGPGDAMAQPGPPDEPSASGADAGAPVPAEASQGDARAVYDEAFGALLAGRLEEAQRGFWDAATRVEDPELRAAARELARLAFSLQERRIRLVADGGAAPPSASALPGAGIAPGHAAEDYTAGRTSFIISTTAASVYGGIVLVDLLDTGNDFRLSVGTVLVTTGAGFLGSYFGTEGRQISEAMADAYSLGMALGVGNSLLLASPIGLRGSEQVQGFALGSIVLGGTAGMLTADLVQPTRGQVNFASLTSILGIASTGLGMAIVQPDIGGNSILLMLAGGLDLGLAAGTYLAPRLDWSLSRTRLTALGSFLGALVGWSTMALITGTDVDGNIGRVWGTSALVGMWGGFGLAAHLTRDMAPDSRYLGAAGPGATTMITPAMIEDGMGLSLAGRF